MWTPPQRLVQDSLLEVASATPDREAIVDDHTRLSYADLADGALRLARMLQDAGLQRGDRVVVFLDNTSQCTTAIFGVLLAGGVFAVVNPQTKADKLAYILNDCEPSFLIVEGHAVATAVAAVAQAPSVRAVYVAGQTAAPTGFVDLTEAVLASAPSPRAPGTIPLDLASLIYTSGTTGQPKGVMLSHASLVFTVGSIAEYLRLSADDRILNVLPLAFTYGLNQLLLTVRLGATLLLERSFAYPAKTLHRLEAEAATVLPAVPTVFVTIVGMSHAGPYPSVRCLTNAAAGLPPALHEGLRRVFPKADLFRMYGLTECKRVCYLDPALIETKPTSVGKAIPGTEAFVLDEQGNR